MGNPVKDAFDIAKIEQDIRERESYIQQYQMCGILDHEKVVEKIKELRVTDEEIRTVYCAELAAGRKTYYPDAGVCPTAVLIDELQEQINILRTELLKKERKAGRR